ncbi:hypothetical protein ABT082_18810, partial [Streptomyces massasporeus]
RVSRISVRGFAVASATAVTAVGSVVGVASGSMEATTPGGLPKRRRRSPRQPAPHPVPADDVGGRSAEENARRMGAFARGTRSGRAARHTLHDDEGNSHE